MKKHLIALLVIAMVFAFAGTAYAADSPVTIVSPGSETTTDGGFLVSVKVTEPITIRVLVDRVRDGEPEALRDPVVKEGTTKLWYYTEQVQSLEPGLYCITVETKKSDDTFAAAAATYVLISKDSAGSSAGVKIEKVDTKELTGFQKLIQLIRNLFSAK